MILKLIFTLIFSTLLFSCSSLKTVDKSLLNLKPMLEEKGADTIAPFSFSSQGSIGGNSSSGACSVCAK